MRTVLGCLLLIALALPARAQDDARAVIEKAIEAHGGAAALDKYPAGRARSKGTIFLPNNEVPFTSQIVYQLPNRLRSTVEVTAQGARSSFTQIQNGDKLSMFVGGLAQQMPPSQAEELKGALYAQNLTRLTPLLKDSRYRLASVGEKTIDGRPTVGVKVSSEGNKDVRLYFDRGTGLLAAVERPGFDARGKPVDQLETYSDYRETGGLKHPGKAVIRQNCQRYIESETLEYQPLEKVDPKEFSNTPP
jgi:hypothetical protein